MKKRSLVVATVMLAACSLTALADKPPGARGGKAFPKTVPAFTGVPPEGFTIGKGTTAYNGSIDGSIYKVNLRSGEGAILVSGDPDFAFVVDGDGNLNPTGCDLLGMRVDPRSNYLFAAGCATGLAYVYDADTGEKIEGYMLAEPGNVINDVAITREAAYFTNFSAPLLYRLSLSANGRLPEGPLPIPLAGDNDEDPMASPNTANGIVATPNGDTLIIGDSTTAQIYRVDPLTGHSDRIEVTPPLEGFIDGIVEHKGLLYILTPDGGDGAGPDWIQVVKLDKDMLTGTRIGIITDPDMDGVASGAMLGSSLYVNNARYTTFPGPDTEYFITRLSTKDVEEVPAAASDE